MHRFQLATLSIVLLALAACGSKEAAHEPAPAAPVTAPAPAPVALKAQADLQGRADSGVSGTVTFTQVGDTVTVRAEVQGVGAGGDHGFHVHEIGDCSAPDFTSAGGHFNPTDGIHGGPDAPERHGGDLGNIAIGEDGSGLLELSTNLITVAPGAKSVVGRGVILHEKADDLVSQPTGDAGGRIACGVIAAQG